MDVLLLPNKILQMLQKALIELLSAFAFLSAKEHDEGYQANMTISSHTLEFLMDMFKDATLIATELLTDGSHSLATCSNNENRFAGVSFGWQTTGPLGPLSAGYKLQVGPYLEAGNPALYPGKLQDATLLARNPHLLNTQLAGFIIGLAGFLLMMIKGKHPKSLSFQYSFLYFALMNISSIFCHNVTERNSELWKLARLADLVFTGASATSLVYTTLSKTTHGLHLFNLVALTLFTVIGDHLKAFPFTAEIVYIGTCLFACVALGPRLHNFTGVNAGLIISYLGLLGLALAIPLDYFLCANKYTYTAIHVVFFSCDAIFLGFLLISVKLNKPLPKTKKIKKE